MTCKTAAMRKLWDRAEQAIVGVLGLAALAIALWQVLSRYVLPQQSISYAEEVMVYLLIWAIMIVSSQLVSTDSHVRPDIVRNIVPPGAARWLEIFNCAAAVAFCAALTWYSWQVVETARVIDEQSSSDLQFPMWIYYEALPAGGGLMSIRYVIRLIEIAGAATGDGAPRQPGAHELPGVD
ncbi:MAG TPA: TRAP transporter small permease [Xanthobacteraceae bacterium]